MTEIITSIIQKVKTELSITEDLISTDLYDLLYAQRNNNHPDKFTNDDNKKIAEEKFKNQSILLKELQYFIEKEKLEKKPSELIVYEKDFELIRLKQEIITLEEEIKSLNSTEEHHKNKIQKLTKALEKVKTDDLEEKTIDLIKLYKPNSKSLFSLGLTLVLTLVFGVLTKIEEVAKLISKYSPLEPKYFNFIVFSILIFIILRYCKMSYEGGRIENSAKKIKTPFLINKFVNYLEEKNIKENFTEMNVYDFLSKELVPKNFFSKILFSKIFHLYSETTVDSMKNIFIYNLLNRKLISISSAENLDRKFKIIKSSYYYDDYNLPF